MPDRKSYYYKLLKPTLAFVFAGLILLFLFPNETKFKYEFVKGKPWQHNRLIAPFSFAIEKTEYQIQAETDSIRANHTPYFEWNQKIGEEKRLALQTLYFVNQTDQLDYIFLDSLLKIFYDTYIIDPIVLERLKQKEIFVVKNNQSVLLPIQNLYTPKKIFLSIQKYIQKRIEANLKLNLESKLKQIDIENYLVSNIDYSPNLTEKLLNQKLSRISTTIGLVQKGELIISTGEIVNSMDYEILKSYKAEYEKRYTNSGSVIHVIGNILIIATPLFLLFLFLFQYRKKILLVNKKVNFILINILLFVFIIILNNKFDIFHIYLIPIVILPVLIRAFFDTRLANFVFVIALLLISYLVPNSFEFIFIQFLSGTVAIFSLAHINKRSHIFKTSIFVFIAYCLTFFGMAMIKEGDWHKIAWENIGLFAGNALMITLSYPLVYLYEKIFGFTSDVTLLELSDTNQPLLKLLSEKAPGTFQHSLQVANISEELIRAIGGNSLLVRTGALYHDIGKMKNPDFFTENQSEHFNPHLKLSCIESSKMIIQHIPDGIEMAKKYSLPKSVIDFIPMHQGTLTTKFFLTTYKQQNPDKAIDVNLFSYPGPKPFSKETAVVMIADSIEAASRSLKAYTHESISSLVDKIIDYQMSEKQFENVNMTFKDVSLIKNVLNEKLATIYHSRIAYPEEK